MRTLQFTAHCAEHQQTDHIQDECRIAQEYVTDLLSKRLVQHGFEASRNEPDKIAVSVESHPLPISVTCESAQDGEGHLVCRINTHADEEQDWFEKIEMQSVIKQLGQAIETTLKTDESFSQFEWKS